MKKLVIILSILIPALCFSQDYKGKTVEYHLHVNDTTVNFTGKDRKALAVNGSIPAPTLYFQVGDTAVIYVHNHLKTLTSTHWHGLLLPNEQDGVPYLTTAPINPGKTHKFKFPITHAGTYWYHSHTMFQEQSGIYGSVVIYPNTGKDNIREQVLVLSDWTNEKPNEVMRYLKRDAEWYEIKKGAVQSWGEAIAKKGFSPKMKQTWQRMPAMDIADVYYDQFLVNGKNQFNIPDLKGGDKIKLRVINGSASTYFYLNYAGGDMEIIEADGNPVVPVKVNEILIAIAETYDITLTIPDDMKYEFQITAQDISGKASVFLGSGMEMKAQEHPKIDYIEMMKNMKHMDMGNMEEMKMDMSKMNHSDHEMKMTDEMNMHHHQMPMVSGQWSYDSLQSVSSTVLSDNRPWREVNLDVTGNMNRYVWSFNNKPLSKEDKIHIKKGENVRFVLHNKTMMYHPLHLHGHFFRLINKHGNRSPLKHTFNIKPMETVTIEFEANEEKDWFFHCHILYHMMAGMARVVSYDDSPTNEQVPDRKAALKHLKKEDKKWYFMGETQVHSQANFGEVEYSNYHNAITGEWRINWQGDYETETHFMRYLGKKQYLKAVLGSDIRLREGGQENTKDNRQVFHAGFQYTLPLFIESEFRIDHTGKVRFQLSNEDIALTKRLRFSWMANTDKEYLVGAKYIWTKYLALSANYDSDFGFGAGFSFTY